MRGEPRAVTTDPAVGMPRPSAGAAKRAIMALVGDASLETAPSSAAALAELCRHRPVGQPVYVAWPASRSAADMVNTAIALHRRGLRPVPHIVARRFVSIGHVTDVLDQLADEAAVDQILLVGGDRDRPVGAFAEAADLLETGLFERYGIHRIGVTGYPEGHPTIATADLNDSLARKVAYGRLSGTAIHVVCQFGFDARAIIDWIADVHRSLGPVNVRIGVAGPSSLTGLVKYARICGVGPSVRFLTRGAGAVLAVARNWTPDALITDLVGKLDPTRRDVTVGLHVYSFGGAARTARWLEQVRRGNFEMRRGGRGFVVRD